MTYKHAFAFILLFFISFYAYRHRPDRSDEFYRNIDLKIVAINSESSLSNDKFHRPQLCNTILFVTLSEPILYCEINTCGLRSYTVNINIDTKWLYNHRADDIVHFDFLRKDRFFTIDRK